MKITIYELLGMIKDGKAPKTIKSEGHYYNYNELEEDYCVGMVYDYEYLLANTSVKGLDDEIEIIEYTPKEENKIPEKLIPTSLKGIDDLNEKIDVAHIDTISAIEKINEIIDYLKSKGDE